MPETTTPPTPPPGWTIETFDYPNQWRISVSRNGWAIVWWTMSKWEYASVEHAQLEAIRRLNCGIANRQVSP